MKYFDKYVHRGKYLASSYLDPDSYSYETQGTNCCLNTAQHKWNAKKRAPSHGSLAWDLATEDGCNSRMVVVYTNAEIM